MSISSTTLSRIVPGWDAVPERRVLVIGHDRNALKLSRDGHRVSFVPDHDFAVRGDAQHPAPDDVPPNESWRYGFRIRLDAMQEQLGIVVPGLGITGIGMSMGMLSVRLRDEVPGRQAPKWIFPTWHLVVVDTEHPFFHPSYWTMVSEARGSDVPDILEPIRMVAIGGRLVFLLREKPHGLDALWREEWKEWLSPYFDVDQVELDGETFVVATRTDVLYPGEEPELTQAA